MLAKASRLTRPVPGRRSIPPNICKNKKLLSYTLPLYHFLVFVLLASPNSDGLAMVVHLPLLLLVRPHPVDEGVEKHLDPGHHLGEDQPDVDHLHVGRLWEAA